MSTNFPTILAGDLNAKDRSWGARMGNRNGSLLKNYIYANNLQLVTPSEYTFYCRSGGDILDIALLKNISQTPYLEVKKELSSDHYPVVFDFHGFYPDPPRKRTKVNWTSFTDKLRNMPCNPHLRDSGEIESEIYSLTSKIQNAIKSSSYACRDTLRNKLPEDISRDIKERNRIRKRFNVTQDPSLKRTINYLNRKIQAGIMEFRSSNWDNLLEHFSTDTSSMWKIVNAMKKDRTYHIAPISHMGSNHYSEEDIANVFAEKLEETFRPNPQHEEEVQNVNMLKNRDNTDYIKFISPKEVHTIIKHINTKKAHGFDGISNRALKAPPSKVYSATYKHL
ncbi:uncharacterized protein LOC118206139 [Stegodyphus dumicola]|uniref:uncharacterized protein LOC118206139 n=1 Tax=Stegodyphus dumicola TaxID=202533 RepID=UPI0015B0970A|nr:uncharacterized protein LOC118206139 [Stegodyphus dumicola]